LRFNCQYINLLLGKFNKKTNTPHRAKRNGRVQKLYERHIEQDNCAGVQPQLAAEEAQG
jgi:hypothetical protein